MTQEIDIKRIIDNFKQRIVLVAFITFIVCVLTTGYALFLEKPYYKATSTIALTGFSNNVTNDGLTTNDITINSKLVSTYQEIIKSKKVLEQAIDSLDLDLTADELASKIKVSAVNDTEIISISVSDRNPQLATRIANKVSNIFSMEVSKIYNIENVYILDAAEIPENSANLSFVKKFIIAFVVGAALGSVIAFILAYFDTTVKTIEQIEDITKLPILGRVPNYNDKKRGRRK